MAHPTRWLWVDVETTGLGYDPDAPEINRDDVILELAAIITDPQLNDLASFGPVVVHASAKQLALMGDYVRDMHTRTGLLTKIERGEGVGPAELDLQLSAWLTAHGLPAGSKATLAGNSVKLDFDFIRRILPVTFSHLGYRVIDVSSFKETLRAWRPALVEQIETAKPYAHEAMDDIRWSIRELEVYRTGLGLDQPARG